MIVTVELVMHTCPEEKLEVRKGLLKALQYFPINYKKKGVCKQENSSFYVVHKWRNRPV